MIAISYYEISFSVCFLYSAGYFIFIGVFASVPMHDNWLFFSILCIGAVDLWYLSCQSFLSHAQYLIVSISFAIPDRFHLIRNFLSFPSHSQFFIVSISFAIPYSFYIIRNSLSFLSHFNSLLFPFHSQFLIVSISFAIPCRCFYIIRNSLSSFLSHSQFLVVSISFANSLL